MREHYTQRNFLPERLIIVHQFLPALAFGNVMMMGMAYFLLKDSIPAEYLLSVILFNITLTISYTIYDQITTPRAIKNGQALSNKTYISQVHIQYIVVISLIGAAWGSSAILFIEPVRGDFLNLAQYANPTALYVASMVTVSGLTLALGVIPSVFIGLALCIMVPYAGVLLLHPETNYNWMGYGTIIASITAFFLARVTYRRSLHTLSLQHENAALLEDLKIEGLALVKANKDKSRFLAAASHDLRQPLHTSNLLLGVLQEELTTKTQKNRLGSLRQALEAQTELLNALLNVSQLDAGIIKANPSHILLNDVLRELENEFKPEAQEQGLELVVESTDLVVLTDKMLLLRILRNLLTNAFRHSGSRLIKLGAYSEKQHISVYVEDFGLGISPREAENIYSEFYQLNNPERDRNKGLGLGLSIVKRLTDLLNSPISMKSEPNVGTCFRIAVPNGQLEKVKPRMTDIVPDFSPIAGRHIMVIDDEKGAVDAMRAVAEQWSCQFSYAFTVEAALLHIETGVIPDILISDYRLPNNKTGLDCIRSIRSALERDIPALVISGDTDPEILKQIDKSQLIFLHKPVKFAQLRIAITRLLSPP